MVRRFDAEPSLATRALQIWQVLLGKAHNRQIMTYGQLADILDYGGAGTLDRSLGHIAFYCEDAELPPLTVLVVNKGTGLPGDKYPGAGDTLHADREKVFAYDWYALFPPTPAELESAYQKRV